MNMASRRLLAIGLVGVCGLAAALTLGGAGEGQPSGKVSARGTDGVLKGVDLPIKRITLYRSGVGSFERRGVIDGDATIQLRFNTEQVNDILKSMVVLDLGGGEVSSVSYGSKEPLTKRLASFGVDISRNPSVMDILAQLRGSKATITTPEGKVTGTILGSETREEAQGDVKEPIRVPYLNLLTESGIRSLNYRTITGVVLEDKQLNDELNKALAALAEHRADRTKTVDVGFHGQGARDVAVAYVNEMPVWKTSYRLVLPDAQKREGLSKDSGMPTLQGWAIVENTTDEDWNNVTLSLVSGRPVSFQMDLYEPLFVERPTVPVPTIPGVAPRIYSGSTADIEALASATDEALKEMAQEKDKSYAKRDADRREMRSAAPGAPAAMSGGRAGGVLNTPAMSSADMAGYAARSQAQAVESGELFQYQVDHPVTVERQRSAMIPILSSAIEGRRVSIYNRADSSQYPMRGIEVTNSSKLQLMPGPISVFDGGAYAGDAQIGHVPPGDKRLLAYAVDLDVDAVTKDSSLSTVQKIRIVQGAMEQTVKQVVSTAYGFKNKDQSRSRTVVVEHPRMNGWSLVGGGAKPSEQTDALYRFEVEVAPGKDGGVTVSQEQVMRNSVGVFDFDFNWLVQQQEGGKLSKAVLDAVREAGRRRGLVEDANRKIAAFEKQKGEIDTDQARLRENLKSIDSSSQLYTRYMTKLSDQETRLDKLLVDLDNAREEATRLQADLDAYIRGLNVE